MIIRHAIDSDFDAVVLLAEKFHQVTDYSKISFDRDTARQLFDSSVSQGLCSVAETDSGLAGFVLGLAFPSVLNRNIYMGSELAWWVEPEYRGSSAGIKLLKHIERSAQQLDLASWSMICLENLSPDDVESMYLRMGYQKAERTFIKLF